MHCHFELVHYFVICGWTPKYRISRFFFQDFTPTQQVIFLPILFKKNVHYNDTNIMQFGWIFFLNGNFVRVERNFYNFAI